MPSVPLALALTGMPFAKVTFVIGAPSAPMKKLGSGGLPPPPLPPFLTQLPLSSKW